MPLASAAGAGVMSGGLETGLSSTTQIEKQQSIATTPILLSVLSAVDTQIGGKQRSMGIKYAEILEIILNENSTMIPREGKGALLKALNIPLGSIPPDFPEESVIRRKISSLKTKHKVLSRQTETINAARIPYNYSKLLYGND